MNNPFNIESNVYKYIIQRINEFKELGEKGATLFNFKPYIYLEYKADIFSELSFCLLTANFSAERGIKIQANIGIEGFKKLSFDELTNKLKLYGHRFPRQRAERIVEARSKIKDIMKVIKEENPKTIRRLIADPSSPLKIKGMGYKEASHFLRNIGFKNIAILDRHVIRFLVSNKLIKPFKTLTPRIYEETEKVLEDISKETNIDMAALDLIVFYKATGKVLK